MVNSINVSYCSFNNPSLKIIKSFTTGNTQSGKIREVSCPPNLFMSKMAVRLSTD
jgi:hypothetical protein